MAPTRKPTFFELTSSLDFVEKSAGTLSGDMKTSIDALQETAAKVFNFLKRRVGPSALLTSSFQTLNAHQGLIRETCRLSLEEFLGLWQDLRHLIDPRKQQCSRFLPDKTSTVSGDHLTHGLGHCRDTLLQWSHLVLTSLDDFQTEIHHMAPMLSPDYGQTLLFGLDQISTQVKSTRQLFICQMEGLQTHADELHTSLQQFGQQLPEIITIE